MLVRDMADDTKMPAALRCCMMMYCLRNALLLPAFAILFSTRSWESESVAMKVGNSEGTLTRF